MELITGIFLSYPIPFVGAFMVLVTVAPYLWLQKRGSKKVKGEIKEAKKLGLSEPVTIRPRVDRSRCIGSGACIQACFEKGVLGMVNCKAETIYGSRCVGHGACARACPVGAIELVLMDERRGVHIPQVSPNFESNVKRLFIAGELGGIGLIRNAMRQGEKAVNFISKELKSDPKRKNGVYDLLVIGSGPAGLAASLEAKKKKMKFLTLEQEEETGGAILSYPREKVVMTQPLKIPLYGKIRKRELSKEELLEIWRDVEKKTGLKVETGEKVLEAKKSNGIFNVKTAKRELSARFILLCIGRRGTPRKLGVPGEKLPKVMYRLLEPDRFEGQKVLVVGGGDSAIEAAMSLASQKGTEVTLSYRRDGFSRIKDGNRSRLEAMVSEKKIHTVMESTVTEIREESVGLKTKEGVQDFPNDSVFVFAGGELPNEFLKRLGLSVGGDTHFANGKT